MNQTHYFHYVEGITLMKQIQQRDGSFTTTLRIDKAKDGFREIVFTSKARLKIELEEKDAEANP